MLQVKNLSVTYNNPITTTHALRDISFELEPGMVIGVVGESGSGKTTLAKSIMGILDTKTKIDGQILFNNTNLTSLPESQKNLYRWKNISMVFQNNNEVLNPLLTIGHQVGEALEEHLKLSSAEIALQTIELLMRVGLDRDIARVFPHQLSGGMQQRVLIAMALACNPDILIVDEPTSSLDAITKEEIISLLEDLYRENKFSMIIISHDLSVIERLSTKLLVLYSGRILEEGFTKDVIKRPLHPYTRGLINSSPSINPYQDLWGIPPESCKNSKGCPFYGRCFQSIDKCKTTLPSLKYVALERKVSCHQDGIITLLEAKDICKSFTRNTKTIKACNSCSLSIRAGEIVALIGQSGSGKTTLASILSGYMDFDEGIVKFLNKPVKNNNFTQVPKGIQMVFQDPFSSINEHFSVEKAIREPLDIQHLGSLEERIKKVKKALKAVQLPNDEEFLKRPCFTLSGGQRQRVSIARSLVMEPRLLIADEISAMLDPSTQANILRLLKGLQNFKGFAMLYITHDLALSRKIADRILVMHQGQIIEEGISREIFKNPKKDYTKTLLSKI